MGDLFKIRIFSSTLASLIVALLVFNIDINTNANKAFAKQSPFIVHGLSKGKTNVVNASVVVPDIENEGYKYNVREAEKINDKMCNAKNYQFLIGSKLDILNFFFVPPDSVIREISNVMVDSKYRQRLVIEYDKHKNIVKANCL